MSKLYEIYQQVGNDGFGNVVGQMAPYFSTIHPQFVALRPGYCEIEIANEPSIHNHLGSVHAIAMCNGAELVAGLMTDVSIPNNRRWIPAGMTVKYLSLAKSDLVVIADGTTIDWQTVGNLFVDVEVLSKGQLAMTATITMDISEK